MTLDELNNLDDNNFAWHAPEVAWGGTMDAGNFPYEGDKTVVPAMEIDPSMRMMKIGLTLQPTEDIGNPFGAGNYLGCR